MKRITLLLGLLFCCCWGSVSAQLFQNTVGSQANEEHWESLWDDVAQLHVAIGGAEVQGVGMNSDIWISTYNAAGAVVTSNHLQLPNDPEHYWVGRDISLAPDFQGQRSYYITGIEINNMVQPVAHKIFAARVLANGALVWFQRDVALQGEVRRSEGIAVVTDRGGDLYVVGNAIFFNGLTNVIAARFNAAGVLMWSNYYNRGSATYISHEATLQGENEVCQPCEPIGGGNQFPGGILVVGEANGDQAAANFGPGTHSFVLSINPMGQEVWRQLYPAAPFGNAQTNDRAFDIVREAQGNFVVVGEADQTFPGALQNTGIYRFTINPCGQLMCPGAVYYDMSNGQQSNIWARAVSNSLTQNPAGAGTVVVSGPNVGANRTFLAEIPICGPAPALWSRNYEVGTGVVAALPGIMPFGIPESITMMAQANPPGYFVTTNGVPPTPRSHGGMDAHLISTDMMGNTDQTCPPIDFPMVVTDGGFSVCAPALAEPFLSWQPYQMPNPPYVVEDAFCEVGCNLTVTVTGPSVLCFGNTDVVTSNPSGPVVAYTWNTGATTPSIAIATAGVYCVTVVDAAGCTASACWTVAPAGTQVGISGVTEICNNGCTVLTATPGSPGTIYNWNTGDVTQSITVCAAGVYCVTFTDNNGCTASACVTVTSLPSLTVSIGGALTICNGACTTLTATATGTAPFTYVWNTGDVTASMTACAPGTYCVTVTDANGCTGTACVTVTASGLQMGIGGNTQICDGGCTTLTTSVGGAGPFTYVWNTGATTPTLVVCAAGTYCVTVTNAAGCTATACVTVTVLPLPTVNISGVLAICANSCTTLTANAFGGGPFTYNWSTGDVTPSITACVAGTYCVTVANAFGCTASACVTVTVAPALTVNIGGALAICNGACTTLTATATGTAPFTYVWNTGDVTASITACVAGNYCVTVTDANGCTGTACVNVTASGVQVGITGNTQICANGCTTLTASAGGGGPFTYVWNTGATSPSIVACAAGTYCVTVTNAAGCTATACVTVTVAPAPTVNITGILAICNGGCTTLTANALGGGPFTYAWSTGAATASINACAAGTYCVTVTNAAGCTASACVNVTVSQIGLQITGNKVICAGSCTTLTALPSGAGPFTFSWSTGDVTPSIVVCPLTTTSYCVTVTSASGCTASTCATVTVNPSPSITFSFAAVANNCLRINFTSAVTGGTAPYTYSWSFPGAVPATSTAANPLNVTYPAAGTYNVCVTVTDANGCTGSFCQNITVGGGCSLTNVDWCYTIDPNLATGFKVTINNVTSDCNGTSTIAYSYDGGVTWTATASKVYTGFVGVKTICVRVRCTFCGQICEKICCKDIYINAPCVIPAAAGITSINVNSQTGTVAFTASTLSPAAAGYDWDFNGDGVIDLTTVANTASTSMAPGNYTACVTIRRNADCYKVICQPFAVGEVCNVIANFSTRVCTNAPMTMNFFGTGTNVNTWIWNFGDFTSGAGQNVAHTYATPGTYKVCLTAYKSQNCYMNICYLVIVSPKVCQGNVAARAAGDDELEVEMVEVSMEEVQVTQDEPLAVAPLSKVRVFPNPTSGDATFSVEMSKEGEGVLQAFDINGTEVWQLKGTFLSGENQIIIPSSNLTPGMYFLRFNDGERTETATLSVAR